MNAAELRMITELGKNHSRRVIVAERAKWIVMEATGGFSANGGSLGDPKCRRFSRSALDALLKKGLVKLCADLNGSHPEKHYGLTAEGMAVYVQNGGRTQGTTIDLPTT
jgi:hypothetical protein